jgi:hypothetical protein
MDAILNEKLPPSRGFTPPPPVPIKHVKGRKSKHRFLDDEASDVEQARPYQYGLVGQTPAPMVGNAPPSMMNTTATHSLSGHESLQNHGPTPFPAGPGSSAHGHGYDAQSPPMSRRASSNVGHSLSPVPQDDVAAPPSRTPRLSLRLTNWNEETDGSGVSLGIAAADFQPHSPNAQLTDSGSPTSAPNNGPRLFAVNAEDGEEDSPHVASAKAKEAEAGPSRNRTDADQVIVHTDGGRLVEGSAGPMPPAYSPH